MATHLTTVYYTAGHSGGHIIPLIALSEQRKQENPAMRSVLITSSKELDQTIARKSRSIDRHYTLPISQQRSWYLLPLLAGALVYSFFKSFMLLIYDRPEKIVTSGSIVAIPVCLAGWLLRIPIELWEVNATPGKTILFLSRCATTVHVCFSETKKYFKQTILSDYPIRADLKRPHAPFTNPVFDAARKTLFIVGGSQGSQGINNLIRQTIIDYPDLAQKIQIIHQAGAQAESLAQFYRANNIPAHVFAYDHDIARYYLAADTIICRSGAGSLFEAIYFQKKSVTIPLEGAAGSHQLDNALAAQREYPALITVIRQDTQAAHQLATYFDNRSDHCF